MLIIRRGTLRNLYQLAFVDDLFQNIFLSLFFSLLVFLELHVRVHLPLFSHEKVLKSPRGC
jgi:hypothetical protein